MSLKEDVTATVVALGVDGLEHPSPRQLAAYRRGELSPSEAEPLRDHLALCRECAGLVLDADIGALAASDESRAWEQRKPAAWASLQARLATSKAESVTVTSSPSLAQPSSETTFSRPAPARRRWLPWAAAAVLVSTLGLGGWLALRFAMANPSTRQLERTEQRLAEAEARIAELEKSAVELGSPLLDVPMHDLFPPSFQRAGEAPRRLEIPADAPFFVLQLSVTTSASYPEHELHILDARGREIWSGSGLRRTAGGTFRIAIPRFLLPAGRYSMELYGVAATTPALLERYQLAIEYR